MKLDELLKCEKVRCIKTNVDKDLVEGEIYKVEGFNDEAIKIVDRNGFSSWHNKNLFETILNNDMSKSDTKIDISENSVNAVNKVIPTFKVGDKVYIPNIKNLCAIRNDGKVITSDGQYYCNLSDSHDLCFVLATQENYEMLCKLYPHIEFEFPPEPLTGNDLTRGMFERGDFAVVCKCSDTSESSAITFSPLRLIVGYSNGRFEENNGKCWNYAVPFDPKTNLPLTEDVLNETI